MKGDDSVAQINLPQELIDQLAQGEADALLEGLRDPEMRKSPAFLAKVRQFLKDNDIISTAEIEGMNHGGADIFLDTHTQLLSVL